jgi:hypothetical protein
MKPHLPEKCQTVALELVSESGRRNERRPKIFKIKILIFRKKNANNFHYNKRSKLDTKYRFLFYINILIIIEKIVHNYFIILNLLHTFLFWSKRESAYFKFDRKMKR